MAEMTQAELILALIDDVAIIQPERGLRRLAMARAECDLRAAIRSANRAAVLRDGIDLALELAVRA